MDKKIENTIKGAGFGAAGLAVLKVKKLPR